MSCFTTIKPLIYPHTRTVNQIDDYFGTKVTDPYRWLEDLDSKEVLNWAHSQQNGSCHFNHPFSCLGG